LKGRATGTPDDSCEALFFEQPVSSTHAAMHNQTNVRCDLIVKYPLAAVGCGSLASPGQFVMSILQISIQENTLI
jgi:hypothetical protein